MIESQNPDGFGELMAAHSILNANREALDRCKERAREKNLSVSCSIELSP